MPLYPSRSPRPPATITNPVRRAAAAPSRSKRSNSSEPKASVTPDGTDGTKPSNGFSPTRLASSRRCARRT
eukprot:jgi/Chrpa1/14633/Chrysochromulina_OHIO_Genome00018473-RA